MAIDVMTGLEIADTKLIIQFFTDAKQNAAETLKQGRPVFDEKTFIQINIPGDKNTEIIREAREGDKNEYSRQWKAYEEGRERHIDGTPLSEWPLMSRSQIAELNAINIWSVENLVDLPDSGLDNIGMGARALQQKAQQFLDAQSDTSAQLAETQRQLAELQEQVASMNKPKRKRRTKAEIAADAATE